MAKTKINMLDLMDVAWNRRQNVSNDEFEDKIKNLISHSFVEYERLFKVYCEKENQKYEEEVFVIYQHIFVFMMLSDGDFLQGEYDAYCKYCQWAGFKPLSVSDTRELYQRLGVDVLANDISTLVELREFIDPENYEALVQGFCYLSLAGDREFDENEYYILRCFFERGFDYAPATWTDFKNEWK